jgi:glycosyltransferase involved in cell wall biosynthesis
MRVLLAPYFDDNQYQELCRDRLEARGVDVRVEDNPRPLRLFAHRLTSVDVLHVHWTHPYFLFGSYDRLYRLPLSWLFCAVAALVFVFQLSLATRLCDRVVWTVHNECNHERRYERLDRWVSTRVARRANEVHLWDERTRDRARRAFGIPRDRTQIVPHGNYLPLYGDLPPRDTARDTLDLSPDGPLYLYFGVIRPYKGVPDLVRAFADAAPEDAALVVAGNPKYDDLEREIRDLAARDERVHLDLNYLPDDQVPTYFAAADVVVLPYRHVFNSGSVVLAMSMARPLVVPALGSIPSVVPAENVVYDDLRDGLRASTDWSPETRDQIGSRNRRVAEEDHGWDDVLNRVIKSYRAAET